MARANIDDEKQRQIENSRAEMENSIRGIQNTIKLMAVALPPIPALHGVPDCFGAAAAAGAHRRAGGPAGDRRRA